MKEKLTFRVSFNKASTHWVSVIVHTSRRTMRRHLTRVGHKSDNTQAACWQSNNSARDNCIAEIHFGADVLSLDNIAHECTHAAYHRTRIIGMRLEDPRFEEWVADDTGTLTDSVLAFLDSKGVKVRYECVPTRKANKKRRFEK